MPTVCVFEGDDAAPEAVRPTVDLLGDLADVEFHAPAVDGHADALDAGTMPDELTDEIAAADTVLFGAASDRHTPIIGYLRWVYGGGTYANVRPIRHLDGVTAPLRDPGTIDYVVVRENLEGLYVGIEGDLAQLASAADAVPQFDRERLDGDGRYALRVHRRASIERVAEFAADLAAEREGRLTCATKSNVLPETDGLFDEVAEAAAREHGVDFEHAHADAVGTDLVADPGRFDVIVAPNVAGDLLSDVGAGSVGGLGMAPSGCYGDGVSYFEPVHGTAPDIAGEGVINPTATLLSGAMCLEYVEEGDAAATLRAAVEGVYAETDVRTPDLSGGASTTEFVDAVRRRC